MPQKKNGRETGKKDKREKKIEREHGSSARTKWKKTCMPN